MHVRESKVRKGGKVYRYVQLVQSYRRADGTPAHRVLASFGDLSETQTASVRTFAKAMSGDQGLLLDGAPLAEERAEASVQVLANLEYLQLAVLLEVWERSGLAALLRRCLGGGGRDVPDADVVAALVLHRCVAADSKLAAERWFPMTALPELFGWSPAKFNNSRLHRALEVLEAHDDELQRELPGVLRNKYGPFSVVLIDGTDTWFEGEGPDIASVGRVKDGTYRRKILIVVACDSRGFPLRWQTFEGRKSEVHALQEMATTLGSCAWLQSAPIIADRALGNYASIEVLARTGRQFVVAVPEHEIRTWVPKLEGLPLDVDVESRAAILTGIERIGLERVDDRTYVIDGQLLAAPDEPPGGERALPPAAETVDPAPGGEAPSRNAELLAYARRMHATGGTTDAIGRRFGHSKSHVAKLLALLLLPDDVQARIEAGEARDVALAALAEAARKHPDGEGRRAAFEALLTLAGRKGRRLPRKTTAACVGPSKAQTRAAIKPSKAQTRAAIGRPVVYFNPEMFVDQRRRAIADLADVRKALDELNGSPTLSTADDTQLRLRADRLLRRQDMASLFDVQILRSDDRARIEVKLREEEWRRRRRFDGFSLLVANPLLPGSPADVVAHYRSREGIERGFRTIKSVAELRPVYHRTDAKVRAHVTICVLATLLHRVLEHHLAEAGTRMSAVRALAILAACHLNTISAGRVSQHTVTALQADVRELLHSLQLDALADDERVRARIVPR